MKSIFACSESLALPKSGSHGCEQQDRLTPPSSSHCWWSIAVAADPCSSIAFMTRQSIASPGCRGGFLWLQEQGGSMESGRLSIDCSSSWLSNGKMPKRCKAHLQVRGCFQVCNRGKERPASVSMERIYDQVRGERRSWEYRHPPLRSPTPFPQWWTKTSET